MSNFIDYSSRNRGNPSPQASIAHDDSTRPDDPFSDRGTSINAPQSEITPAANPYGSPFAQNSSQRSFGEGHHYGGHGGEHIETEHVETMGDTARPQYNDDAFFDPSFGGEC